MARTPRGLAGLATMESAHDGAAPLDPTALRAVAEEVRQAFPRPLQSTQVILIDVDPDQLHAFWNLPYATVNAVRRSLGPSGDVLPLVLRVTALDETGAKGNAFDVDVQALKGQTYIDIWGTARRYQADLGLRRDDGTLVRLAGSNMAELPRHADSIKPASSMPTAANNPAPPARPESEPVPARFPLPPQTPDTYDPALLMLRQGPSGQLEVVTAAPALSTHPLGSPTSPAQATTPPAATEATAVRARPTAGPEQPLTEPFPSPPSESSDFDPYAQAAAPAELRAGGPGEIVQPALEETGQPHTAFSSTPQAPLAEPFPPPPTEGSDFDPHAMLAGSGAPPADGHATQEDGARDAPICGEAPAEDQAGEDGGGPSQQAPAFEPVMSLSSFVFGQQDVELEVSAELHIYGHTKPGSELRLFGQAVPLRPDGSFSIRRALPTGALVITGFLAGGNDDGTEQG